MTTKKLHPVHPGEILQEEFIKPMVTSQRKFAAKIGVTHTRLNQIVNEKQSVTADTVLRLAKALGTTAEFQMICSHDMTWIKSEILRVILLNRKFVHWQLLNISSLGSNCI